MEVKGLSDLKKGFRPN